MKKPLTISPKNSYLNLFIWIVALLLIAPLFDTKVSEGLVNVFFSLMLFSSVYALSKKKSVRLVAALLAVPALIFNWLGYFYPGVEWNLLTLLFSLAFIGVTIVVIFKGVFTFDKITFDRIFGALCVYFLIGIFWALLYALNELLIPQSFISDHMSGIGNSEDIMIHFNEFTYFSFVTLTTLGYGDIVPVKVLARNLSIVEAVTGQFYIATVVAGLIGTMIKDRKD